MRKMIPFLILAAAAWFFFLRGPDHDWPLVNARPVGRTVVAFGDSLTEGVGAAAERSYPAQLAAMIHEPVINAGVRGDTAQQALKRLERDVLAHRPRLVLITLGGNDILRKLPIEQTIESLRAIFSAVQARGALVVYGAIDPPMVKRERLDRIRDLCRQMGVLYVPELMDGLWLDAGKMSDQIHPNGDGYRIVAERFYRAIKEHL